MARYDKYDPPVSGFRAPLAANLTLTAVASQGVNGPGGIGPVGVSLDANGRVIVGGTGTGIVGVLVKNMPMGALAGNAQLAGITSAPAGAMAGDIVDVMKHGEITDVALVAGTKYYADATTGVLTTTAAGNVYVGHTVEATRLVVNMAV